MPKLNDPTTSQDQYPVGENASQTQPYVPIERTIGIGQLPPIHFPADNSLLVIQENGLTGQITLAEIAVYFGGSPVKSVNGMTGNVELGLSDLTDVTITNPLNANFLSYNSGKWVNKSLAASAVISFNGFQGVISNAGLNILSDVTITNPLNRQTLMYSTSKGRWENQAFSDLFPDITDVDGLVTITGANGLKVNNALSVYGLATYHAARPVMTALTPTTNASSMAIMNDIQTLTLNALANVDITNVADKDFILWDATTNKWQNYNKAEFFPDITDKDGLVTITGPAGLQINNMLNVYGLATYHAARPVMTTLTPTANASSMAIMNDIQTLTLDALANVEITNVADKDFILWSAASNKWENYDKNDFFPDLTDANGLVTITGPAGLRVNNMLNTYGAVTFHDNRPIMTDVLPTTNQYAVSTMGDLQNLDLNHLHDVAMSNPVPNGNVVSWNEIANKWINVEYDPTGHIPSMLWTPTSVTSGEFSSVCFDANFLSLILASKSNAGLYWTKDNKSVYQSNITSGNFYKVIVFKDTIYAAGDVGVLKSSDGKIWTTTSIIEPATNLLTDGNILLIFFSANIGFKQTSDGITFTSPVTSGVYEVGDVEPKEDPTQNIWLLGGSTTTQNSLGGFGVVSYSLDGGSTWVAQSTAEEITAITYARGNSFLASSTDGLFAATVTFGTSGPIVTWEKLVEGNYTDVVFNSGLILALRLDDIPLWSTDAFNWNPTTGALPSLPLHTAAFGNGYWSAGGINTGIWWSIDGKEWALSNQVTGTLNKVIYGGTAWLALMGNNGGILWSNNTAGKVLSVNGQTGIVEIGLNNLRGTKIIAPTNGDFLIYKNGLWENRNIVDISNISVHNITVTETATIDNLVANTSAFSGLSLFNGGLKSTTGIFTNTLTGVGANFSGALNVTGLATVGSITSSGAATLNSTLSVTGASTLAALTATTGTFSGALVAHDISSTTTLKVTSLSTLAGVTATTLGLTDTLTGVGANFSGALSVTGLATVGSLTSNGTATLNSTLSVTGTTTLAALTATTGTFSGALVAHDISSTTTLSVVGVSTLAGVTATTLRLTDTLTGVGANFSGAVSLNGTTSTSTLTVGGTLTVNGLAILNSALSVTGNTNLGNLSANNPVFQGTVSVLNSDRGYSSQNVSGNGFQLWNSNGSNQTTGVLRYLTISGTILADLIFSGTTITYKGSELSTLNNISASKYAQAMPAGVTDLNDYIAPGQYVQLLDFGALQGVNYPVPYAGMLTVSTGDVNYLIWQTYTLWKDPGTTIFTRNFYLGSWGPWLQTAYTDSPSFVGTPTAPTAPTGTNTLQLATTAFVQAALSGFTTYPNLTSSGAGIATLLTYAGTQGVSITKGPLVLSSETPSTFLYRPTITTLSVNNTNVNSIATISDITSGTLLDAKFKTVASSGALNGVTLAVSGASTLTGSLTANGGVSTTNVNAQTLAVSGVSTITGLLTANGGVSTTNVNAQTLAVSGAATFTTGPTAPTAPTGTSTTQLATTEFVQNATRFVQYTTPGNFNFVVPAGLTTVYVTMFGGGGGGGGGYAGAGSGGGGGGGGGSGYTVFKMPITVTPGSTYVVTVGAGGTGGQGGDQATSGTASSFGTLSTAQGGRGGSNGTVGSSVNGAGGQGGQGGNAGNAGQTGGAGTLYGACGGAGGAGLCGGAGWGGAGWGGAGWGGAGWGGGASEVAGGNGAVGGGGGGGATLPNSSTNGGGNGGTGVVLIEW